MMHEIDLSRADLNLLVVFEAVLEEGHVGRAAERLRLSPSAVSHGLSRLRRLLNDPLFIKTPKGVVPTERGLELAAPIAAALQQVRQILSTAEPFDPARSRRRFIIGAPDGVSAVILSPLLDRLKRDAPGVDIGISQLLPAPGETVPGRAWAPAFRDLESRAADIAIIPIEDIPARFQVQTLFEEDFVIAVRPGHPLAEGVTVARYCEMEHLVVSMTGDPHGFVDQILAAQGMKRRTALTLPNFMFALAVVAETDMVCALPRRFVELNAGRFDVIALESPFPMRPFKLNAVVPGSAVADPGVSWLLELLMTLDAGRSPS